MYIIGFDAILHFSSFSVLGSAILQMRPASLLFRQHQWNIYFSKQKKFLLFRSWNDSTLIPLLLIDKRTANVEWSRSPLDAVMCLTCKPLLLWVAWLQSPLGRSSGSDSGKCRPLTHPSALVSASSALLQLQRGKVISLTLQADKQVRLTDEELARFSCRLVFSVWFVQNIGATSHSEIVVDLSEPSVRKKII